MSQSPEARDHGAGTVRRLRCACCDGDAGRWVQHWNRDKGFGVCAQCVDRMLARGETMEHIVNAYGTRGINWGEPGTSPSAHDMEMPADNAPERANHAQHAQNLAWEAVEALIAAYDRASDAGGSVKWEDLDHAHGLAVAAQKARTA